MHQVSADHDHPLPGDELIRGATKTSIAEAVHAILVTLPRVADVGAQPSR
jgi:hypothetical protein